ncbi:unnamed protein product [Closterium sp. Naga37s-1]|nr:unnamed protein product [Closterium sp. Naga37s-1]
MHPSLHFPLSPLIYHPPISLPPPSYFLASPLFLLVASPLVSSPHPGVPGVWPAAQPLQASHVHAQGLSPLSPSLILLPSAPCFPPLVSLLHANLSAYIIAGLPFSILAIEHCILRAASFQPALAGLLPVQRYRRGDVRYSLALDRPEPLVTFALSCGCASAPPVRVYRSDTVHEQLKAAAQDYIRANVNLHPGSGKILLPKLLHWYSKDFARNAAGLLQWAAEQMEDGQKQNILQAMGAAGASKKVRLGRVPVQVLAYEWTFQYLLA